MSLEADSPNTSWIFHTFLYQVTCTLDILADFPKIAHCMSWLKNGPGLEHI
jgi:hypothetical protein